MNIDAMRKIDAWAGVPACFLLTVIHTLVGRFHAVKPGQIRKILFVKPAEQGAWDGQGTSYTPDEDKVYELEAVSEAKEDMEWQGLAPAAAGPIKKRPEKCS